MIFPGIFRNCGDGMFNRPSILSYSILDGSGCLGLINVHQMIQAWHHVHVPLQRQHVSEAVHSTDRVKERELGIDVNVEVFLRYILKLVIFRFMIFHGCLDSLKPY